MVVEETSMPWQITLFCDLLVTHLTSDAPSNPGYYVQWYRVQFTKQMLCRSRYVCWIHLCWDISHIIIYYTVTAHDRAWLEAWQMKEWAFAALLIGYNVQIMKIYNSWCPDLMQAAIGHCISKRLHRLLIASFPVAVLCRRNACNG